MKGELILLGTGASAGIPAIACSCAVCRSSNPRNKRTRSSALLKIDNKTILIDAGPDLRQQALLHNIDHLDGVIFTHTHFDHTGGVDELRAFNFKQKQPLLCLASDDSVQDLLKRYYYLFQPKENGQSQTAKLSFQVLQDKSGHTEFIGIPIDYVTYEQGGMAVNGYRFGDLAYISDIRHYTDDIYEALKGTKTLVLSALRESSSPLHFSISEAVAFAERVGAKQTWLTHIAHDINHDLVNKTLPPHIQLAYDGLAIDFEC